MSRCPLFASFVPKEINRFLPYAHHASAFAAVIIRHQKDTSHMTEDDLHSIAKLAPASNIQHSERTTEMNDLTMNIQNDAQTAAQTRIVIYTDGACLGNPGPGGWAATVRRFLGDTEIKKIQLTGGESDTTNNRMEMEAAIAALKALRPDEIAPTTIFSDSKLLIDGMTEWLPKWQANGWRKPDRKPVKNRDLWEMLVKLTEGRNVTWQWVRGHAGDPFNEEVDVMAWEAARRAAIRRQAE